MPSGYLCNMEKNLIYIKNQRLIKEIHKGLSVTKSISIELLEKLERSAQSLADALHEIVIEKKKEIPKNPDENGWLTTEEVGKKLNLHPKTVGRYCREKKIKGKKMGKGWLIKKSDIE